MKNITTNLKNPLVVVGTSILTTVLTFFLFDLLYFLTTSIRQYYGIWITEIQGFILLAIIWFPIAFWVGFLASKFITQEYKFKFRIFSLILSALFIVGIIFYSYATVMWYSFPSGGSFVEETKVLTPNGVQSIENLKVGDKIIGYDYKDDKYVISTVQKYRARMTSDYYLINDVLGVTSEHPIAVRNIDGSLTWKRVRELNLGEKMVGYGENDVKIYNLEKTNISIPLSVYNLQTSFPHNYFVVVGNTLILVHNKI
ncbi:MAG: polymorphic toxin-type HINT domain-containing protein [bacterium]|nr:polymorphic toxin-type HINT domain-containing protein [bacterium]